MVGEFIWIFGREFCVKAKEWDHNSGKRYILSINGEHI